MCYISLHVPRFDTTQVVFLFHDFKFSGPRVSMAVKFTGTSSTSSTSKSHSHLDTNFICLCSDGKSVTVNPGHLASFSGYFSSLLHSEMKETRTRSLNLKLIHSDVLQTVLKLLTECQKHREDGIEYLAKVKVSGRKIS